MSEGGRAAAAEIAGRLRAAGCIAAEEEAGELLAAAADDAILEAWIRRREHGEPLAWITGTTRFCDHSLHVDPGVYVPRLQSEELARRAASILAAGGSHAADLCTGAGAVAAHLMAEASAATVVGVDLDPRAAACARRNGVHAIVGDLDGPLRSSVFDVVTAVAPYVPTGELRLLPSDVQRYESALALDGGEDGLAVVRWVVAAGARLLRRGGWLLLEIGGDQDRAIMPTLDANGFSSIEPWFDEDGDLRGVAVQATG